MTLLAGTLYDPGTLQTKATSALLAMTAFNTTNLRLGFTAPANGAVLVRLRCSLYGATALPGVLLGVLEGATVRARSVVIGPILGTATTSRAGIEALFVVPGLTPSASLTWDAAYGVELSSGSTSIRYGGPNDTTTDTAQGGFAFEIYDCPNLLGAVLYDPAVAVSKATSSLLAMTAFDTTNLRITFTAPASGIVLVRMRCVAQGSSSNFAQVLLGVLSGSTVIGRVTGAGGFGPAVITLPSAVHEGTFVVTGLTPGSSNTWDAAYGVEIVVASTGLKYGGPNDTASQTAFGGFQYEIWAV